MPAKGFNRFGRGYPDLSVIAVDYQFVLNGVNTQSDGTGMGMPVLAAWISVINSKRMALGQSSVGFINPTLYARGSDTSLPSIYNDIKTGSNFCIAFQGTSQTPICCSNSTDYTKRQAGFFAANGW